MMTNSKPALPRKPSSVAQYGTATHSRGFTLIELMVTVAVLAILLGIAVPSFTDATLGSKLEAQANSLSAGARLARGEAIKRSAPVRMCQSSNGTSCAASGGWGQGWIVTDGTTVFLQQQALPSDITISSTVSNIVFPPTGVGATAATLSLCRASGGSADSPIRSVVIDVTGRASVKKSAGSSCS